MNREFLKGLGLEDEVVDKVMAEYGKSINAIKDEKETLSGQLEEATNTLGELKNSTESVEELKNKIAEYEAKVEELEEVREQERKEFAFRSELEKAGAVDTDYLLFKLGDLDEIKLNEDGELENKDKILKQLKQEHSAMFKVDEAEEKKIADKPLPQGESKTFTVDDIKGMSAEEINENWDIIKDMKL